MMLETNGMYGMHSGMRNEGGVCVSVCMVFATVGVVKTGEGGKKVKKKRVGGGEGDERVHHPLMIQYYRRERQ